MYRLGMRLSALPLLLAAVVAGCQKDATAPPVEEEPVAMVPVDGIWHGYMDGGTYEGVTFNVKGGRICAEGTTLNHNAALVVKLPYQGVTITSYIGSAIELAADGRFTYTHGLVSDIGGQLTVEGTFTSRDRVAGKVSHEENSSRARAQMSYSWTGQQ